MRRPSLLIASLLVLAACAEPPFELRIQLLVDEAQAPLAGAASITVDLLYEDGEVLSGSLDPVSGEHRIEDIAPGSQVVVEVTASDSGGTTTAIGRSQPVDIGEGSVQAAVFVASVDSIAHLPQALTMGRTFSKGALAPGDRVVLVGGGDGVSNSIPTVEFIGWSPESPLTSTPGGNLDRIGHELVYIPASMEGPWAGQVVCIGGTVGSGRDTLEPPEIWSDAVGTISLIDPLSGVIERDADDLEGGYMDFRVAWTPEDQIALFGGFNEGGQYQDRIRLLDPSDGSESNGPLLSIREQHTVTSFDFEEQRWHLVAGGITSSQLSMTSVALWNGEDNVDYMGGLSLSVSRARHQATAIGSTGKVLITGGATNLSSELDLGESLGTAEIFDLATQSLEPTDGAMLIPRQRHVAIELEGNRVLVCAGISTDNSPLSSCEVFDLATGEFSSFAGGSMSPGGEGMNAVRLPDGRVLFAGGFSSEEPHDGLHIYTPSAFLRP